MSPKTALAVGLKVGAGALPTSLKQQIKDGKVDLDNPATTLALLKLNSVVLSDGVIRPFSATREGRRGSISEIPAENPGLVEDLLRLLHGGGGGLLDLRLGHLQLRVDCREARAGVQARKIAKHLSECRRCFAAAPVKAPESLTPLLELRGILRNSASVPATSFDAAATVPCALVTERSPCSSC